MQRETVEVMTALTEKIENLRRPRDLLMDVKELGKFCTWTTILEAGRNGVVSGEVVLVIFGGPAETENRITKRRRSCGRAGQDQGHPLQERSIVSGIGGLGARRIAGLCDGELALSMTQRHGKRSWAVGIWRSREGTARGSETSREVQD